jgi:hypothetical protein
VLKYAAARGVAAAAAAVNLLVSGDPEKGKATAEQETLATSISRLTALLGKAQAYVEDVVVSAGKSAVTAKQITQMRLFACMSECWARHRRTWRTWW